MTDISDELAQEYRRRFRGGIDRRIRVWKVLVREFFSRIIPNDAVILDLGCGWGEFINNIDAKKKFAMDLNSDSQTHLDPDVRFFHQDSAMEWPVEEGTLDWVFTSNFFEHLPDKHALNLTLMQARRCLKPGGGIICLGPNIRALHGRYWDFYDHSIPLTDQALKEALELRGFRVEKVIPRFLPYTMVDKNIRFLFLVSLYLKIRIAWRIYGKQFLIIARKP